MSNSPDRTLVLSLDGATWSILRPLINQGRLDTLKSIRDSGISGPLRSVIPPLTTAAWTSFQLGISPNRHGITTFKHITDSGRSNKITNSNAFEFASLWDYLDDSGLNTISVNLPVTFPAKNSADITISGVLTPSINHNDAVYPPKARDYIDSEIDDYKILVEPSDRFNPHESPEKFVRAMEQNAKMRRDATLRLMSETPDWDFCLMHIQATDVLQHPLWSHIHPDHPKHNPSIKSVVDDFYEIVDEILADVIKKAQEQATSLDIMVISDHGFQGYEQKFYVDSWLEQNGYLVRQNKGLKHRLLKTASRLDYLDLQNILLSKERRVELGHKVNNANIVWDKTTVWGHGNDHGYLYVQDSADKEEIKSTLKEYATTNPGSAVIDCVIDTKEEFDVVHSEYPDLILVPTGGTAMSTLNQSANHGPIVPIEYREEFHIGGHARDGIFAMTGPGIESNQNIDHAQLIDVMPTILYRLGCDVPDDLDGKVLEATVAESDTPDYRPPLTVMDTESEETETDREKMEERLQSLGYME